MKDVAPCNTSAKTRALPSCMSLLCDAPCNIPTFVRAQCTSASALASRGCQAAHPHSHRQYKAPAARCDVTEKIAGWQGDRCALAAQGRMPSAS
eukprot:9530023-Alexandrium_andersonii.AAC.1